MKNGTMKAVVYHGPNNISLDDVPLPQIIEEDDVIIKVTLSAICTSDVHIAAGHLPNVAPGQTLGHEFCGEIIKIGPAVQGFKVGDRVMVDAQSHCGKCENCINGLSGRFCLEEGQGIFGVRGPAGCQAEYMRLPHGALYMKRIPEGMNEEDVILVTDMLATAWFGVQKVRVCPGDTVVVIGCGPVGLSTCTVARLCGAATIIAVDVLDYPLEAALKAGVTDYAINSAKENVIERLAEITDGKFANAVIESAGSNDSFNTALDAAGLYGRVCSVSIFAVPIVIPSIHVSVVFKNLELHLGIQECEGEDVLIEAIQKGEINPRFMLTHKAPLNDILKGYDVFSKKQDGCIKWLVTPYAR